MQEMLKITGIRKSFSTLDVLKGVDLTVHKGEVVSLIGPSGSGKTTLLRCANFLDQAEDGTMVLDGQTYHLGHVRRTEMYEARRHTAFVFQNYNLFLNKTALQNVTEGLIVARKMPRDEAEARAQKALEKVGLGNRGASYPNQLSGAARGHCPGPGPAPGYPLLRRAHQRAGPGADRGSAGRDAGPGRRWHDNAGRDPRDGLCPQRF